jgi:3-deoxy-D-manno-octulosonate 8-phosphate phosphatase (KDO 8-P phosphatase)
LARVQARRAIKKKGRAAGRETGGGSARALSALVGKIQLVAFDFDGVFTDNTVYVSEDGTETVRCWRSDGLGLKELARLGVSTVIVSTETNAVVQHRSRKMGIRCINGCDDKLAVLQTIVAESELKMNQVAFVGNDVNDIHCLRAVGLPIVVANAHESVLSLAKYRTAAEGGRGAVREVCDLFTKRLAK